MTDTITIPKAFLTVAAMFAAKKDIRYYLNGVCIDTGPNGTFLVATDGNTMCVALIDGVARPCAQLVLPAGALDVAIKANKAAPVTLTLPADLQGAAVVSALRSVTISAAGAVVTVAEMDGRYPDWRRVAKHDTTQAPAYYHPDYVSLVAKAGALLDKRETGTHIRHGGDGCGYAQMDADGRCVAYVMPMRVKALVLPNTPGMTY